MHGAIAGIVVTALSIFIFNNYALLSKGIISTSYFQVSYLP